MVEDIVRFLFNCDKYMGLHYRLRNQMTFGTQLILLIDVRPTGMIESDVKHQSDESLHDRDIEFNYQRVETHHEWLLYVKLRSQKGHRE